MARGNYASYLNSNLDPSLINSFEYQDKYYLKEKIRSAFPNISEEQIYKAIDIVRGSFRDSIAKSEFIERIIAILAPDE